MTRAPAKPGRLAGVEKTQAEAVAFLADPATHGVRDVECVETHISRIFLAGDRAWKLRRAVRTNYLDFTRLAGREAACRREIEVNRAAGEIYVGVVPVMRRAGGLALGGPGDVVDWLVEMRRFDRACEFDRLCEAGGLTLAIVERLADAVAALHRAAPVTPEFGDEVDLDGRIDQIAGALAAAEPGFAGRIPGWQAAALAARRERGTLIARRHWLGRTRRCHGDLHLGNIVLLGGRPVPFDAIEFNEAIASIDVLYDISFALADLVTRGRADLANGLLSRYLGATRDYGGLAVLPLCLSMRGAVRAMTAASRGASGAAEVAFAFAETALVAPPAPRLVAIGGLSGTGKSTVARGLAPDLAPLLGAVVIRSDVTRKRLGGVTPEERLPPSAYTAAMDRAVTARMAFDARRALRAGASVVLDATFLGAEARDCAAAVARSAGAAFDGVWLALSAEEAARRVANRRGDASDASPEVVAAQAGNARPPAGWQVIDAGADVGVVLAEVIRRLGAG